MSFLTLIAGCLVHRVGLVEAGPPPALRSTEAGRERLVLVGEATRLAALPDHLVEVTGRRTIGRVVVETFRPLEGPHGLPVTYGPVQQLGVQVGIQDLVSGMLVWVDAGAADALRGNAGRYVAAEGYIDGPQHLVVLHYRFVEP